MKVLVEAAAFAHSRWQGLDAAVGVPNVGHRCHERHTRGVHDYLEEGAGSLNIVRVGGIPQDVHGMVEQRDDLEEADGRRTLPEQQGNHCRRVGTGHPDGLGDYDSTSARDASEGGGLQILAAQLRMRHGQRVQCL